MMSPIFHPLTFGVLWTLNFDLSPFPAGIKKAKGFFSDMIGKVPEK